MSKPSSVDMLGRSGLMRLDEALATLYAHLPEAVAQEEPCSLEDAVGRILARDVVSTEDIPPHPRSTMDGFAVRASDTFGASESLPAYLRITGEALMGCPPLEGPEPECCVKISTGGLLPLNADAVVMLEHTVNVDEGLIEVTQPVAPGVNLIDAAEDVAAGSVVLENGRALRPQDAGLLAGLGIVDLPVRRRVGVGIISTGDEIVPPTQTPSPGKIRDVNAVFLSALVRSLGCLPRSYGIVEDREDLLRQAVQRAMDEQDVVILSGSSSVGARDMGERVLGSFGPPGVIVHGVAIKPGKPVIVAMGGGKLLFGLPGHPVSAAVAFDFIVRPALQRLSGAKDTGLPQRRTVNAVLSRNLNSASGRLDYVRVKLVPAPSGEGFTADPVLGKSGAVSTMVEADGFILIEESKQGLRAGETVEVFLFD